jgi:hypothetical protein
MATGLNSQLGWALEATPGTAESTIDAWADTFTGESMEYTRATIRSAALRAGSKIRPVPVLGADSVSGGVEFEISSGNAAHALRQAIGTEGVTGAGPYVHTFVPSTTDLPSTTVEIGKPEADSATVHRYRYSGCMVNGWSITVAPSEEFIRFALDYIGMGVTTGGSVSTPTFSTVQPFAFVHATLTMGGATQCFTTVSLQGANNISAKQLVCPTNPRTPKVRESGFHDITGSVGMEFDSMDFYDAFVAGTVATFSLLLDAGSTSKLEFEGDVIYTGHSAPVSGPEVLEQTVPFEFVRQTSDANAFSAILTNSISTSVT